MPQITIKEYVSQRGSRFTQADAKIIGPELTQLSEQGGVTRRDVLDTARSSNSPLHSYFEWDNKVAADLHRIHQAGQMLQAIRVRYIENENSDGIGNGKTKEARAFQVTINGAWDRDPRPYRSFAVLHGDSAFAARMMESAYSDLGVWKSKYEPYADMWERFGDCFQAVINQIDEFADDHSSDGTAAEMDAALAKLLEWRDHFAAGLDYWTKYRVNLQYIMDAIADAEALFKEIHTVEQRKCLKCGNTFKSAHIGHRICEKCFPSFDRTSKSGGEFEVGALE